MANTGQGEWDRAADASIRRRRDAVLSPLSKILSRWGVPAPAISLFGVVLAAVTLLLLLVSMLMNPRHIGPTVRAAAEPRS